MRDVIIVGGAVHGASLAYHLAADAAFAGSVLLIEKDPTFATAATALSAGSIRQQFSTPVNIAMSLYGIGFLREIGVHLAVDDDVPDVGLQERGYLFLATEHGAAALAANHARQTADGADIVHLDGAGLADRFPYIATNGIAAGAWGRSGEGWFDGYALMRAFARKARSLGAKTLNATVLGIESTGGRATGVRLADGSVIAAETVVLAAGTGTPALAASLGILLPVEARKRMVFTFTCRDPLPGFPLLIDPSGVWVRPEGDLFIAGAAPPPDRDPPASDFAVDHGFFEESIWPALAHRVPAFQRIKPGQAWAGHYDMNTFDHNAIIGPLAGFANLLVATGFSGHGLQQAPAVGRGLAELIVHGRYLTLDLAPLGHARIVKGEPLIEQNVV